MQVSINVQKTDEVLTLDCRNSERILLAGLRAGHNLPYECATGTCGNCKAQVIAGSVESLWPDAPGAKSLKSSSNEILMCQATATENCTLKIRSLSKSAQNPFKPEYISGFITRAGLLTHDVQLIELKLNSHMDYLAGQFVIVGLPEVEGYRAYSMIEHDQGEDTLQLIIKNKSGRKYQYSDALQQQKFLSDSITARISAYDETQKKKAQAIRQQIGRKMKEIKAATDALMPTSDLTDFDF